MTARTITVKIYTPLPIPAMELTGIQKLAEKVAKAAGAPPDSFIGMTQEGSDLVIYFEIEAV